MKHRKPRCLDFTLSDVELATVTIPHVMTIVGARPQFIKSAPVSRAVDAAIAAGLPLRETLVHTGQHYDRGLSDVFFQELGLRPPAHHLGIGSGPHGQQTGRMLEQIERVLLEERPALVLVYGDTNSTLAGALAAAKLHVPVAHVEAGARSYRRTMPEEVNRVLTDHVATWRFCATPAARAALEREGIRDGVHVVGDVMYDAVMQHAELARDRRSAAAALGLRPRDYAVATVHRAENTDDPARLASLLAAFRALARERPIVWPVHPRTRRHLTSEPVPGLHLIEPVSYLDMLALTADAGVVITDSGGVQREAFFLRVPCVTVRDETEWEETVTLGWNQVAGSADPERIIAAVRRAGPGRDDPDGVFGDGRAAERIVATLRAETGTNAVATEDRAASLPARPG